MAEDMGERTEAPTERRRTEARNRAQVAKSQDLAAIVALGAAIAIVAAFGGRVLDDMRHVMRASLEGSAPGSAFDISAIRPFTLSLLWAVAPTVAIFMACAFAVAAVGHVIQVGWLFTTYPLQPKLERLNPINGFGRLFSVRNLVKTFFSSLKLAVVIAAAWMVIQGQLDTLAQAAHLPVAQGLMLIGEACMRLALILAAVFLVIALADFVYQRWQHNKDLKMTKHQVKDERRSMDGDPEFKQQRLRRALELMQQRIGQAVPRADVIITNPTHFAVALEYRSEKMKAPRVTAKGADLLALRMRQLARLADVPIVERPPLARALYYGIDVGQEIRAEHYEAVAEVLAFVYRIDSRQRDAEQRETPGRAPAQGPAMAPADRVAV